MNTRKLVAVFPLMLALLTGCTSLGLKKPDVWPFISNDDRPMAPTQVVANFTDTILYQGSETPVRGFGGRLMFYTDGRKDPCKVEGTLSVYAFDEKDRDPNNTKPDRKFVFTKDQLAKHYSKSKLGHSYSVWIPWDDAGGEQKDISLIVRFTPDNGGVVVSEQTKHVLPGRTDSLAANTAPAASPANNGMIQPVSYLAPTTPSSVNQPVAGAAGSPPRSMTTTTIAVPPSSILKASMNAGMNNGAGYPATMTMAAVGANGAMPYGQAPSMNTINSAAVNYGANPAANQTMAMATGATTGGAINSMSASAPQYPAYPPPNRFGPGQLPAPGASFAPPTSYHVPLQPRPIAPAFGPGGWPGSPTNGGYPGSPATAGSTMN